MPFVAVEATFTRHATYRATLPIKRSIHSGICTLVPSAYFCWGGGWWATSSTRRIPCLRAYLPRSARQGIRKVVLVFFFVLYRSQVVPRDELGRGVDDVGGARSVFVLTTRHQAMQIHTFIRLSKGCLLVGRIDDRGAHPHHTRVGIDATIVTLHVSRPRRAQTLAGG